MRKVEIPVYAFDELSEEAQSKAINDQINAMIELIPDDLSECYDGLQKAINDMEGLHTPWFLPEAIWENCREEILDDLHNMEFLDDGNFFGWKEDML